MREPSDQDNSKTDTAGKPDGGVRLNRIEASSNIRILPVRTTVSKPAPHQEINLPDADADTLEQYQKISPPAPPRKRLSKLSKMGLMAAGLGGVVAVLLWPTKPTVIGTKTATTSDAPSPRPFVTSPEFTFEPTEVVPTRATISAETTATPEPEPAPEIEVATPVVPKITAPETPEAEETPTTISDAPVALIDPEPENTIRDIHPKETTVEITNAPAAPEPEPTTESETAEVAPDQEPTTELVATAPQRDDWESGLVTDMISGTLAALRAPGQDADLAIIATLIRNAESQGASKDQITDLLNTAYQRQEIDVPAEFLTADDTVDLPTILARLGDAG